MTFFGQKLSFGKPLDKVAKAMAILDLVLAALICTLLIIEIVELKNEPKKQGAAIHEEDGHDFSSFYEMVRLDAQERADSKIPTAGIVNLIAAFIGIVWEAYLCRTLYGAAKHGDGPKLKWWWFSRLALDLLGCTNTILRIVLVVTKVVDVIFPLIYIYRIYELVLVWNFRNELA